MAESERRYTIRELLRIAEDRMLIAKTLKETPGCGAAESYYEWSNTVFALRFLRDHGLQELPQGEPGSREVPAQSVTS